MKITRYAHMCLLVEEGDARIIVDPGTWNETPDATNISAILITHEHQDHFDIEHIKAIRAGSPDVVVITHEAVAKLLAEAGIGAVVIEEGGMVEVNGVAVESFGHDHAIIYGDVAPCVNTGYLIGGKLFVPGDALHDVPSKPVAILALPTGGPWMKIGEAIDYAKAVKAPLAFPVHDAMHTEDYKRGFIPSIINRNLEGSGVEFRDVPEGGTLEA